MHPQASSISALDWYATMPEPVVACPGFEHGQVRLRRYSRTPEEMVQPALSENVLCRHMGGAKEVRRWHSGHAQTHYIEPDALTIMPAHESNRWLTRGPVDFTHVVLNQTLLKQIAVEEFGSDWTNHSLLGSVGFCSPGLAYLCDAMLDAFGSPSSPGRLYTDALVVVIATALLKYHSTLVKGVAGKPGRSVGGLTPARLRRVVDHMTTHLTADIGLSEIASVAGLSRAQFFRAFRKSTGTTPARYLMDLRLEKARTLLSRHGHSVERAAESVGIRDPARLSELLRRRFGNESG